jgi:hypothetical protein
MGGERAGERGRKKRRRKEKKGEVSTEIPSMENVTLLVARLFNNIILKDIHFMSKRGRWLS